jgi:hypothetical protein
LVVENLFDSTAMKTMVSSVKKNECQGQGKDEGGESQAAGREGKVGGYTAVANRQQEEPLEKQLLLLLQINGREMMRMHF